MVLEVDLDKDLDDQVENSPLRALLKPLEASDKKHGKRGSKSSIKPYRPYSKEPSRKETGNEWESPLRALEAYRHQQDREALRKRRIREERRVRQDLQRGQRRAREALGLDGKATEKTGYRSPLNNHVTKKTGYRQDRSASTTRSHKTKFGAKEKRSKASQDAEIKHWKALAGAKEALEAMRVAKIEAMKSKSAKSQGKRSSAKDHTKSAGKKPEHVTPDDVVNKLTGLLKGTLKDAEKALDKGTAKLKSAKAKSKKSREGKDSTGGKVGKQSSGTTDYLKWAAMIVLPLLCLSGGVAVLWKAQSKQKSPEEKKDAMETGSGDVVSRKKKKQSLLLDDSDEALSAHSADQGEEKEVFAGPKVISTAALFAPIAARPKLEKLAEQPESVSTEEQEPATSSSDADTSTAESNGQKKEDGQKSALESCDQKKDDCQKSAPEVCDQKEEDDPKSAPAVCDQSNEDDQKGAPDVCDQKNEDGQSSTFEGSHQEKEEDQKCSLEGNDEKKDEDEKKHDDATSSQ